MNHMECCEAVKNLANEMGLKNEGWSDDSEKNTSSVNEVWFENDALAVVTTLDPECEPTEEHFAIEVYLCDPKTKQEIGQIYPEDYKALKLPEERYVQIDINGIRKCFENIRKKSRASLEKRMF